MRGFRGKDAVSDAVGAKRAGARPDIFLHETPEVHQAFTIRKVGRFEEWLPYSEIKATEFR
jgi:hypothetical protein